MLDKLYKRLCNYNFSDNMRLVLLGPPGSGKGTYASRLSPKLGIPHICMGYLCREEVAKGTELGKEIKRIMEEGGLQRDEVVIKMLKERLEKEDALKGFILDGFPRTIEQAKALEDMKKLDIVINLAVADEIIIARLSSRMTCKKCFKIYNILYLKPKKEGICDICGGELFQRKDDTPEVVKERIKVYNKQTEPLIMYYKDKGLLTHVTCESVDIPPEVIVKKIINVLKEKNILK